MAATRHVEEMVGAMNDDELAEQEWLESQWVDQQVDAMREERFFNDET